MSSELSKILTERELEVAENVTRGMREKEISEALFVSLDTVRAHTYSIRKKLNARNAVDIARMFLQSIESPKKFVITIGFVLLQSHVIYNCASLDLRKPSRNLVRTTRVIRKHK